jgi:hypothetical protein
VSLWSERSRWRGKDEREKRERESSIASFFAIARRQCFSSSSSFDFRLSRRRNRHLRASLPSIQAHRAPEPNVSSGSTRRGGRENTRKDLKRTVARLVFLFFPSPFFSDRGAKCCCSGSEWLAGPDASSLCAFSLSLATQNGQLASLEGRKESFEAWMGKRTSPRDKASIGIETYLAVSKKRRQTFFFSRR